MRILHVSEVAEGGTPRLLMDFARHQTGAGHEVHIAGPALLASVDGTRYHPWNGDRRRIAQFPSDALKLRGIVREIEPDVVHLHSFFAGFYGRLPSVTRGVPVVYQPHSWAFDSVQSPILRQMIVKAEVAAAARTTAFALNCRDEIDEAADRGLMLAKARWLGVGVDLGENRPYDAGERSRARVRLGIEPHQRAYLLAGRICRQKGQDLLVPVWDAAPPPDSMLILAGPGDTSGLQKLARRTWGNSIRAIGHSSAMVDWYNASDVMIVPSRYEGQSVAISEALACALPVVAFDVNGARSMIVEGPPGEAGAVTRIGDAEGLLRMARRRGDDAELRAAESTMARRRARLLSDPKVVYGRLDALYEGIRLSGSGPP